jgi:hypothetical protein
MTELADYTAVTPDELVEILRDTNPGRMVTYTYTSGPSSRMRKTKPRTNPYWDATAGRWRIRKTSRQQGMIGASYKNAVNNQRAREAREAGYNPDDIAEFEPQPRYWGERVEGTPLVRHEKDGETRWYMEVLKFRTLDFQWKDDMNQAVSEEDVRPFIRERSGESSRQGTDKPIRVRNVRVDHLDEVSVDGRRYRVIK